MWGTQTTKHQEGYRGYTTSKSAPTLATTRRLKSEPPVIGQTNCTEDSLHRPGVKRSRSPGGANPQENRLPSLGPCTSHSLEPNVNKPGAHFARFFRFHPHQSLHFRSIHFRLHLHPPVTLSSSSTLWAYQPASSLQGNQSPSTLKTSLRTSTTHIHIEEGKKRREGNKRHRNVCPRG